MNPAKKNESDAQLYERIKKSDEGALGILMDRYYLPLCQFCNGFIVSAAACEELVADLFYLLWAKRGTLKIHSNFKSYLYTAVKNNALKSLRGKNKPIYSEVPADIPANSLNALEHILLKEKENELEKLIDLLPIKRRKILRLKQNRGLSHKEIAALLKISEKTVLNQLRMATKQLQQSQRIFNNY